MLASMQILMSRKVAVAMAITRVVIQRAQSLKPKAALVMDKLVLTLSLTTSHIKAMSDYSLVKIPPWPGSQGIAVKG